MEIFIFFLGYAFFSHEIHVLIERHFFEFRIGLKNQQIFLSIFFSQLADLGEFLTDMLKDMRNNVLKFQIILCRIVGDMETKGKKRGAWSAENRLRSLKPS